MNLTLPRDLRRVAAIQMVFGVLTVIEVLVDLVQGRFTIALGVLGIPIALGLLRLSRAWRACCVAFLVMGLTFGSIVLVFMLCSSSPVDFRVFSVRVATIPRFWVVIVAMPLLALTWWQLRVLVRPDVTHLFLRGSGQGTAAAD